MSHPLPMIVSRPEDDDEPIRMPVFLEPDQFDPALIRQLKTQFLYFLSGRAGDEDPKHDYFGAFTIPAAARRIGLPTRIIRAWMDQDKKFATATEEAIDDALGCMISREFDRAAKAGGKALETVVEYRKAGLDRSAQKTVKLVRKHDSEGVL